MKGFGEVPWGKKKKLFIFKTVFPKFKRAAGTTYPTDPCFVLIALLGRPRAGQVRAGCGRGAARVRSGTCGLRTSVPGTGQGDSVL